jgi:hypothetical protein
MRRHFLSVAAALLLATSACSAAGYGGSGAPKATPANATATPSYLPTPTGGMPPDPYGY